jgi:putative ABC transport system permease protein
MFSQDVRFAVRLLWKNPGFTAVAVLALGLGIGANTAIFSVVQAVLLRPLPYIAPDRIVELKETALGRLLTIAPPNYLDWKTQSRSFESMAAYNPATATLNGAGEPEQIDAAAVAADLFHVLGVTPLLGRGFLPDEERPGGPRAVVLGYGLWQRRFGGDPRILERSLTFDGVRHPVVGVMPRGFVFPETVALWFPRVLTEDDLKPAQRGAHYLNAIARLKPGVTVAQAYADLSSIEQRIAEQFPDKLEGYGVWVRPLYESVVGGVRRPLLMILGAVGFVLLIACANVSNLLLARATTRGSEIAVRVALGAGRFRIVRQLLAESVMLSLASGIIGVLLAAWGVRALSWVLPADLPRAESIDVNLFVLAFSVGVSVITGLLFGVAPAIYASTPDVGAFLRDGRHDGSGRGRRTLRSVFIASEVALSLVLLAGAGLALRSFARLSAVSPGFDPSGLLSVTVVTPEARYPDAGVIARFYRTYVEELAAEPGVSAAGAVMIPPLAQDGFGGTFSIAGKVETNDRRMQVRPVTAGYLEALRIPLKRGRLLTPSDREGAQPVVVISEEAAKRYWPGEDPIGKRLRIHVSIGHKEPQREVVGVVGDVRIRSLDQPVAPVAYVPHAQYSAEQMTVFVRAAGDPVTLLPAIKSRLARIDPEIALTRVRTGDQIVGASVAQPRFRMVLLGLFAAIALVLAAIGLYGVMAFAVGQRQSELGLRMALGADAGDVLRLVLRQGLAPVAAGLVIGLLASGAFTQVMTGLLYEVEPFDPPTLAAVACLLALVATTACYLPARRATRIDPLSALRR